MGRYFAARRRLDSKFDPVGELRAAGVEIPEEPSPDDPYPIVQFNADPALVEKLGASPNILIEPEIMHWPLSAARRPGQFHVVVRSGALLLEGADVRLIPAGLGQARGAHANTQRSANGILFGRTDASGEASFSVPTPTTFASAVVSPTSGHWEMIVESPSNNLDVDCAPFTFTKDGLGWWHRLVGMTAVDRLNTGKGINIGVIDTGVGPHDALNHVERVGTWLVSDTDLTDPSYVNDVGTHGTHVCGIIAARPEPGQGFLGISPGASVYAARVFDRASSGANQKSIADALTYLCDNRGLNLLNLSLGAHEKSLILLGAIERARDLGCLTICAAGNCRGSVLWPAAGAGDDLTVAVSAVGAPTEYPPGSLAAHSVPIRSDHEAGDGIIFAEFCCVGSEITCCAPGVGIISTIPAAHLAGSSSWAAMNGTSMATPVVTGVLAAMLANDTTYLGMAPDAKRTGRAETVLKEMCQRNGLLSRFQGHGMPVVRKMGKDG